ncbi:MAG: hypothetical protein GX796_06540, partial [Clostridiaceae bacterium]|nr:hypothetical protein [Clostridiaceae bacterium]
MKPESKIQLKNIKSINKQNKLLIVGVFALLITLGTAIYLSQVLLGSTTVYSGVHLDGISLGGLDKTELSNYLENKYRVDFSSLELYLYHEDYPLSVYFDELDTHIDKKLTFDKVYNTGRQGGYFKRLVDIFKINKDNVYLETEASVNMNTLNRIINQIDENTCLSAVSSSLMLFEEEVIVTSAETGFRVNKEVFKESILSAISKLKSSIIIVPMEEILPLKIDTDTVHKKIIREPQNAYVRLVDGEIEITPEITGRSLDKAEFLSLISDFEAKPSNNTTDLILPVDFIKPEITTDTIKDSLFRDVLSVYSTSFTDETEHDKNRATNIKLAVEAINGTILFPGETFSFNNVVGQRTSQKGYLPANIYSSDGIASGIGGGICQVSSTLYNSALRANLSIVERNPHIYMVAYVPLGLDASVTYATQDLKFTNNTKWPLRIDGNVSSDNKIEFAIIGTNENPSFEIVIQSVVTELIP